MTSITEDTRTAVHELAGISRVLLVEDDESVALPLVRTLEREGYLVTWVESGEDALEYLTRHQAEVVVLDLGLPGIDGLDVCRRARAEGYAGGLIIVTARGAEVDRVIGLDHGADDYLTKPFGLAELHARVRALMRRTGIRPADPESRADLLVEVGARRVRVGGAEVVLGAREFDVLRVLAERRDEAVPRHELVAEVWSESSVGSRKTLDVTVARLRQKLENAGAADRIVAVRGIGFRLESAGPVPGPK
jgi:DNA-binding response OmpR family regulator